MTNILCGLEDSTYQNTCDHEHEVDLRNIHLTMMFNGSVHHRNSWETA